MSGRHDIFEHTAPSLTWCGGILKNKGADKSKEIQSYSFFFRHCHAMGEGKLPGIVTD